VSTTGTNPRPANFRDTPSNYKILIYTVLSSLLQPASDSLQQALDLERSSRDLSVPETEELRIADAPLASPDLSTLSGSSESSIQNADSQDQIAGAGVSNSGVSGTNSGGVGASGGSGRTTGGLGVIRDTRDLNSGASGGLGIGAEGGVISGVIGEGAEGLDSDSEDQSDATLIVESVESDTGSSSTLISSRRKSDLVSDPDNDLDTGDETPRLTDNLLDEFDADPDTMKGEKVRAIAEKLNGKLVLGASAATEQRNGANIAAKTVPIAALTPESSDTDSVNTTPSDSPAKTKLDGVVLRPPSLVRAKNSGKEMLCFL
jgi:hypothetical protein